MATDRQAATGRAGRVSREATLAAAWALFEEIGYDATSMTAIAERAGISRRTLFNQVAHKVGLLYPPIQGYVERFAREMGRRPSDEPLFAAMTQSVRALVEVAAQLRDAHQPGPQVRAARQRDDAVDFWRAEWARRMAAIVLAARGPKARIQADLAGALTAQVWAEFVRMELEGSARDAHEAMDLLLGELERLAYGPRPNA